MDYMKYARVAAGLAGVSFVLGVAYKKFVPSGGIGSISFSVFGDANVGQQITSGFDTSFAGKIVGSLAGSLPSPFGMAVTLFVTMFLILLAGHWINNQFLKLGKTPNGKLASDIALGALAVGVVAGIISPSINKVGLAVAIVAYAMIVVVAYNGLRKAGLEGALPTLD